MRNVSTYGRLERDELEAELVEVTGALAAEYISIGSDLADQHRDFLQDYVRSAGSSVAAKNREAQYNSMEITQQIIHSRAKINSLTLCRDLLVFLMLSRKPGEVPFPAVAAFDEEGMANA